MSTNIDARRKTLYLREKSAVFAYSKDPRFCFCLYIPPKKADAPPPGLVVAVHHSMRNFIQCRDTFADLGERHNQVVLAPLFPINVLGDGNPDGYKYLIEGDIRYDLVLNGMIEDALAMTDFDARQFCLFGYSGGGHFAHRYALVHPERVRAVSVCAPGQVTLLKADADWWVGVRDMQKLFGRALDLQALKKIPVQLAVGIEDLETWEIEHAPGSQYWRAESAASGANRVERLRALQASFEAAGLSVQFDLMQGVMHLATPAMTLAQAFFGRHILKAQQAGLSRKQAKAVQA